MGKTINHIFKDIEIHFLDTSNMKNTTYDPPDNVASDIASTRGGDLLVGACEIGKLGRLPLTCWHCAAACNPMLQRAATGQRKMTASAMANFTDTLPAAAS